MYQTVKFEFWSIFPPKLPKTEETKGTKWMQMSIMAVTGQFLLLLNLIILLVNYSNHSSKPTDVPLRVSISSVTGNSNNSFRSFTGLSVNDRSTANFKFKFRAKRFLSCRVQYTAQGNEQFSFEERFTGLWRCFGKSRS